MSSLIPTRSSSHKDTSPPTYIEPSYLRRISAGELDPELTSHAWTRLDAVPAIQPIARADDDGESNSGSWVALNAMQAFEHAEDALLVFGHFANAVVLNPQANAILLTRHRHNRELIPGEWAQRSATAPLISRKSKLVELMLRRKEGFR